MIEIRINGNIERIEDDSTLDSYLQILGLQDRKAIAIALIAVAFLIGRD